MTKYYYAAESDMGLSMTYDSPCWMVLAFESKDARDEYVKAHSEKCESVNAATARKVAPELKTKSPESAWRVVVKS